MGNSYFVPKHYPIIWARYHVTCYLDARQTFVGFLVGFFVGFVVDPDTTGDPVGFFVGLVVGTLVG